MVSDIGIELVNGQRFSLAEPDPASITPEVIAHALSHLCRFTGHVSHFYSVAQHCVMVSRLVPEQYAMAGLLHDASEAFIGDISSPLKWLLNAQGLGVVYEVEARIHHAIAKRFGLIEWDLHRPEVKLADLVALSTEARDLMPMQIPDWGYGDLPAPAPVRIWPWSPLRARAEWMVRYVELGGVL